MNEEFEQILGDRDSFHQVSRKWDKSGDYRATLLYFVA